MIARHATFSLFFFAFPRSFRVTDASKSKPRDGTLNFFSFGFSQLFHHRPSSPISFFADNARERGRGRKESQESDAVWPMTRREDIGTPKR